jgi:lipopolysaccharide transport system ATP-binding protein
MIEVTNLGKRYILRHQAKLVHYRTIREAIMDRLAGFARKSEARRTRDEFWALHDVSFSVREGEAVAIVGHNGAGKSTLLKVLSRITEPTRGEVRISGRVASLLEVGTGFHPELTGRENIFLNGAILGMTRAEVRERFDRIVDFAEVERFLDTPVKRYSSGMFVRLAFAVAAHLEPEVLIVDEVLAVGDTAFQRKCLDRMREVVRSEGRTVLFVSHNTSAVKMLCPRAILLERGGVVADGPVDSVIDEYMRRATPEACDGEVTAYSGEHQIGIRNGRVLIGGGGNSGELDLIFELYGERKGEVGIGLSIQTEDGVQISRQDTQLTHLSAGCNTLVVLRCSDLLVRLAGGRYSVDVWVSDVQQLVVATRLVTFDVPESDDYGTGRGISCRRNGPLRLKWELSSPAEVTHAPA